MARLKRILARRVLPRILGCLRSVTPASGHVVVAGFPATEGNAVETVRALCDRYQGKVIWLDAPDPEYIETVGLDRDRIVTLKKASIMAMWKYSTASAVFFTHGLYGEPNALARKPTVNLWHGDGPKKIQHLFPERRSSAVPSDFLVSGSRVWGEGWCEASGLNTSQLLHVGLPRNAQLHAGIGESRLSSLGVDVTKPWVLWLPAFRRVKSLGTMRPKDDAPGGTNDLVSEFHSVVTKLSENGIDVFAKPHPMDSQDFNSSGVKVISDEALMRAGVPFYTLLGAASGLITDYSSVMTDFVLMNRPIGFFMPDADQYIAGRGLYPDDILDYLPGRVLSSSDEIDIFVGSILKDPSDGADGRQRFRDKVGLVSGPSPADAMLDMLRAQNGSRFSQSIAASNGGVGYE